MVGRRSVHRKRCGGAIFFVLLALVVQACTGVERTTPNDTVPQASAASDCRPLHIVGDSPAATRPFELEADAICRQFGVRPELHTPSYLGGEMDTYVARGQGPVDLVIISPRYLNVYAEKGLIRPVDQWIDTDSDWFTDVLPLYRDLYMRFDNHYYGFVYDGDSQLLFYRKDLLNRLQLSVPNTWEEYDQVARALAARSGPANEEHFGTAFIGVEQKAYISFAERFASLGGHYFDDAMHPQIDSDLGVKVLTELVDLQAQTAPEAMYDWEDLNHALLNGRIPMAVQWSDTARFSYDKSTWKSQVAGQLGWALVPGGAPEAPRGGIWFGRILSVASKSTQPEIAAQVALYMTGPEVSGRMTLRADTINDPYRTSHFASQNGGSAFPTPEDAADFYRTLAASLTHPMADLTIPGGWEYTSLLDQAVVKALRHDLTPKQALQEAAAGWNKITAQYGEASQRLAYRDWRVRLGEKP